MLAPDRLSSEIIWWNHLEAGRLALALHDATQAREHYDAARKLIDETGYHRRDGELREIVDALASRKAI